MNHAFHHTDSEVRLVEEHDDFVVSEQGSSICGEPKSAAGGFEEGERSSADGSDGGSHSGLASRLVCFHDRVSELEEDFGDDTTELEEVEYNGELEVFDIGSDDLVSAGMIDFHVILRSSPHLRLMVDLYRYCIDARVTHRSYKTLRRLSFFEGYEDLPVNLNRLQCVMEIVMVRYGGWPEKRISFIEGRGGKIFPTPFLSVSDALSIWLTAPPILAAILSWNRKYLPSNLLDEAEYDAIALRRERDIACGFHNYEHVADGSVYLDNIRSGIPLFKDQYERARRDGLQVLVCNFGFYEDSFSKSLNSRVNQTVFTLSLVEATTGEAHLTGLSSLIVMLASSEAVKSAGDNDFWAVFTEELKQYERGVRMIINGEICLVIAFSLLLMGDTPALKSMCGLSPSISKTCYVRMPCRICEILVDNLYDGIVNEDKRGPLRNLSVITNFYRSNGEVTGVPGSAWLKEAMKLYGFLRIPEFIKLHNQPAPERMGIDTMHALFLGVLIKHFIIVMRILLSGNHGEVYHKKNAAWGSVCKEFSKYCRLNKIAASWRFSCEKEFKKGMTAGCMREFTRVSPLILRKLGIIRDHPYKNTAVSVNNWKKQIQVYNYWCVQVRIADIVGQHNISSNDTVILERLIRMLLMYFHEELEPEFVTINVHYYLHFVDQIRWLGPMRIFANNSREHLIQEIKPLYRNTNNRVTEASIFNKYRINLFFKMNDLLRGSNNWKHDREIIPQGAVEFDFYSFDEVIVDWGLSVSIYMREDFNNLHFLCDKSWKSKCKLEYCVLQHGDYVVINGGCHTAASHFGQFQCLLQFKRATFVAYRVPNSSEVESTEAPFLYKQMITTKAASNTLYVVPKQQFCTRVKWYEFSRESIILVAEH